MFDRLKGFFNKPVPQGFPIQSSKPRALHILDKNVTVAHSPSEIRRIDGWGNALTGLGIYGQDKSLAALAVWTKLAYEEAAAIYASDPLAQKIVHLVVESALFHDYRFALADKDEKQNIEFNQKRRDTIDKDFKLNEAIKHAAIWSRVFGSAYILIGADDGQDASSPLDLKNIKKIDWIKAFDAQELFPSTGAFNPDTTNFLFPEYYTLATYGGDLAGNYSIHHSRVIRFSGKKLLRRQFIQNGYTDDSVLNPIKQFLSNYNQAIQALSVMIQEWSVGVIKVPGLAAQIASGNHQLLHTRMSLIDKCKSVIRSIIIGKDEEYSRMSSQYQGVDNIAQFLRKELATHVDIPHTILFNEGPSSGSFGISSGKGESEQSDWQAIVAQYQKHNLEEQINRLYKIVFSSKENELTKGEVPEFDLKFTSARPLTLDEEAEVYSLFSQADREYLGMGVITNKEIRESRFSDTGTFKDLQTRIELSDATVLEQSPAEQQDMDKKEEAEQDKQEEIDKNENNEGSDNKPSVEEDDEQREEDDRE